MKKIKIPSDLTSLAYRSIKQSILEGQIDQDCRLTESMLSTQLGISRSPIREALNSLATEGLITIQARRGASLRRFTEKEVNDLYDLRKVLEIYAVSTVAITPQLLETLAKSIQRSKALLRANKKNEFIEEDMHFHDTIAQGTGNQPLASTLANVQNQIWLCRCKTYNLSSSRAPQAHQSIVDALKQGNRALAKKCMGDQIDYVRQQLINSMRSLPVSQAPQADPGYRTRPSAGNGNRL
jgi:DNA-binding GntR family transcriptional regulator